MEQTGAEDREMGKRGGEGRGRLWKRLLWALIILAVLVGLVVFVLPTPLARYVVSSQLDSLGIRHQGGETIVIDLWNSRVHVGPMELSAGEMEPAKIGTVDVTYSLGNVFKRRALIETFTLSGIDIRVRRLEDGSFQVNGIKPPAAGTDASTEPTGEEQSELGAGFGMQSLEFVDSQLVLEDTSGGTLTLELDRFLLEDFLGWEPEVPEKLTLEGTLNGMRLAFRGTSTLFARPITFDIEGGLQEVTLDKVAMFTGPTGLERQKGTLATNGRHAYTIREDGAIEGTSTGTIALDAFDLATPKGDTVAAGRIEISYDLQPTISADDTINLGGGLDVTLSDVVASTAAGGAIEFAGARVGLADLALTKLAERRAGEDSSTDSGSAPKGPAPSLLDALVRVVIEFGREVLRHRLEGSASPTLELQDFALEAGDQTVRLGELSFGAPGLTASGIAETWSLATPLSVAASAIAVNGDVSTEVGALSLETASLEAKTDLQNATINFDVRVMIDKPGVRTSDGIDLALERLAVGSEAFEVSGWPGRGRAAGSVKVEANTLRAAVNAGDAPTNVEAGTLSLALTPLKAENTGTIEVRTTGRFDGSAIAVGLGGPNAVAVKLAALGIDIGEVAASTEGQSFAGDASLSDLVAETESEPKQRVAIAEATVSGIAADPAAAIAVESVALRGLDAEFVIAAVAEDGGTTGGGSQTEAGNSATAASDDTSVPVRLGSFVVDSGSQVRIVDQSAGEAVQLRFDINKVEVGPIDTAAPASPTSFAIDTSVEDTSSLVLNGSATPLAKPPDADVEVRVDGFPLPLVSPYAAELAGVTIESGDLTLAVDTTATAGDLAGEVGLTLDDLFLGEPSEATAAEFEKEFGVPMNFAVGLLKDGDGVIRFDLPVSGTVDAPAVDYSEVVSKAIRGALTSVFPTKWFGAGGTVAIEPVPFAAGTAELAGEGTAVADRVAEILAQKSTLRVRVCGKGAAADLAALRGVDPAASAALGPATDEEKKQVLELALERAKAVHAYLVERHSIADERIGECRTSYSFESEAPPRAEFQL